MAVLDTIYHVLPYVQWTITVCLFIATGIAWCFILWIVPIIKLNKSISAIASLIEVSKRGGRWLDPVNGSFAFLLAFIAILVSRHPDASEAALWKYYAVSSAALFNVAWWERVFIFPLEDWIAALDKEKGKIGASSDRWMDATTGSALHRDMDKWCRYHSVRATLPLIAGLVALSGNMRW
ncbi:hypothetical protein PTNB73_03360 [Pyrenophora teres f. teres]|uniref:DUF1772 domain containing protein n=2 Tax=Pyrenophora teres f. teres TaxID=97479 RepID=E3RFD8_PYRTT|nr:hypothetical protein PTT_06070 [Pyrenophora teres f. teres 0-1]KAE8838622.1 hypothetical protein HRS9139_03005 [Pyrenophora teres f. teres]CAA9962459.1 DUF1772 domain containing protein [Pyrenophora teres f. maculata]KAE8844588.1 hypothetical protein PTNB85_02853 [Pyrenophora teres f. teres]KAE8847212.1 hypothetical protein HRS9122_04119 [Pyrenophora teres f. teres]